MKFRYMIIWIKTCQKTEKNLLPWTMIIDKQQKILTNMLWLNSIAPSLHKLISYCF